MYEWNVQLKLMLQLFNSSTKELTSGMLNEKQSVVTSVIGNFFPCANFTDPFMQVAMFVVESDHRTSLRLSSHIPHEIMPFGEYQVDFS